MLTSKDQQYEVLTSKDQRYEVPTSKDQRYEVLTSVYQRYEVPRAEFRGRVVEFRESELFRSFGPVFSCGESQC